MPYKEDSAKLLAKIEEQNKIFTAQDARAAKAKDDGGNEEAQSKAAEPTTEEAQLLKDLDAEISALNAQCMKSREFAEMRERNEDLSKSLRAPTHRPDYGNPSEQFSKDEFKSEGQRIVGSREFKEWLDTVAPRGKQPNSRVRLTSPTISLKELGLGEIGMKSLVMTTPTTAGGAFVRRDYGPWPIDLPLRPTTIRDVITILQTGSNLVEYVRVNSLTRGAAIVPEATSTTDDNALKPEAGMAFETVQTAVKTIAVTMPATRTILSDVPMLESMITNFLRTDLELELEDEIISGPGGANHFTGLENTPNLTPQAVVLDGSGNADIIATTRKARTQAMIVGRARSTGFLMNPYDWESFDLKKDGEDRYYFGGPLAMGTKSLWGLPVIESEVIPQGTFYTGDLRQMVVWDRQDPTVYMTDSHSDWFKRNLIAILYEGRWAFGVLRPPAIVKGDLHKGANS